VISLISVMAMTPSLKITIPKNTPKPPIFAPQQHPPSMTTRTPPQLSRVLFWDTDYDKIDWDGKARYVIERVVTRGNWSDWLAIRAYYGLDRIRTEMLQSRDLDKKTLHFLSTLFDIPQEQFRCYTYIQSNPGHWVY
jgi:hypothetical protein